MDSARLSLTPIRRHRRTKQHPIYYKTECVECALIISIKWEYKYVGTLPNCILLKFQKACPFCNGEQIKTLQINEKEYLGINQDWNIIDSTENKADEMSDWLSWIHCETK